MEGAKGEQTFLLVFGENGWDDRETGPIEFGMKNLGLRIYVPGGKYKGIGAQGIRVQGYKSKRHKSIRGYWEIHNETQPSQISSNHRCDRHRCEQGIGTV